jgi:hypothetical protein
MHRPRILHHHIARANMQQSFDADNSTTFGGRPQTFDGREASGAEALQPF